MRCLHHIQWLHSLQYQETEFFLVSKTSKHHTFESSSVILALGERVAKSLNISSSFNMCWKGEKGKKWAKSHEAWMNRTSSRGQIRCYNLSSASRTCAKNTQFNGRVYMQTRFLASSTGRKLEKTKKTPSSCSTELFILHVASCLSSCSSHKLPLGSCFRCSCRFCSPISRQKQLPSANWWEEQLES